VPDYLTIATARRVAILAAIAPDLDTSPGSWLCDDIAANAGGDALVRYALDNVRVQMFAATATGEYLRGRALDAGLDPPFLPADFATSSVSFLGSPNAPAGGWVVPQGTNVFTAADVHGTSLFFQTTSTTVVPGSGLATATVRATLAGAASNVASGALSLMDTVTGITLVPNAAPATGGVDEETDDHLRARIAASRAVLYSAAAIRAAALTVLGCQYASLIDPQDGSGHTTLRAAAQDGTLSNDLRLAVQNVVNGVLPLTETSTVVGFDLVRAVIVSRLLAAPGWNANVVRATVLTTITQYVLTLDAGQTIQPYPLAAYLLAHVAGLADFYLTSAVPAVPITALVRFLPPPIAPALTTSATGGSLLNLNAAVQLAFVTAAGPSLPSPEATITLAAGTTTQSITVTVPTFPDATVTACRVYARTNVGVQALQGTITTSGGTLTISSIVAGAAPVTTNTVSEPTITTDAL